MNKALQCGATDTTENRNQVVAFLDCFSSQRLSVDLEGGILATEGDALDVHQNEGMLDVKQESNWVFFCQPLIVTIKRTKGKF